MSFNNNFSQDDYFRSNPNLKSPTYKQFISKDTFNERYNELKLIFSDINYFAKKYFYIISLDKGKCLIDPYAKQCELLQSMQNYKRNIILASRQVGKCVDQNTLIKIRNKKTLQIQQITIKEFFERIKKDKDNEN